MNDADFFRIVDEHDAGHRLFYMGGLSEMGDAPIAYNFNMIPKAWPVEWFEHHPDWKALHEWRNALLGAFNKISGNNWGHHNTHWNPLRNEANHLEDLRLRASYWDNYEYYRETYNVLGQVRQQC